MPVPTLNVWPAMPRRREIGRLEARVGHRKAPEKREKEPSRAAVANSTCSRCWLSQSSSLGPAREVRVCRMRGGPVDVGLQRLRRLHRLHRRRAALHQYTPHCTYLVEAARVTSSKWGGREGALLPERASMQPGQTECSVAWCAAAPLAVANLAHTAVRSPWISHPTHHMEAGSLVHDAYLNVHTSSSFSRQHHGLYLALRDNRGAGSLSRTWYRGHPRRRRS